MYDANSGACTIFNELVAKLPVKADNQYRDKDWRQGLPWLSYSQDPKILLKSSLKDQGFQLTVGFYSDATTGRS
jgi:hypothetical protein